jgi:signal transduction histidine kinase
MDPHQTKIFSAILVAASILGIIVIYFIITIVRNQRRHLKLQQANLLVEITTLENERKRIVSDLHDELGPLLSVVKFQVSSLETEQPEDLELIEKANENLDTILDRIRGICNELMPQVLIRKGLISALREYIHEVDIRSKISVDFSHDENIRIPDKAEIHLYRIIQEIINNALKHSNANTIIIHMSLKSDKLVTTISDDGKGFDSEAIGKESRGFGLKNILSRVNILKGDLYLASEPGKGTRYSIEIPCS